MPPFCTFQLDPSSDQVCGQAIRWVIDYLDDLLVSCDTHRALFADEFWEATSYPAVLWDGALFYYRPSTDLYRVPLQAGELDLGRRHLVNKNQQLAAWRDVIARATRPGEDAP